MSLYDLQAQLRSALDQQFAVLKQQYERGVAEARQQALLDAQRLADAKIAQVKGEMQAHVEQLVAGARADAEQRTREAGAIERDALERQLRHEFDQQVVEAVSAAQAEAEQRAREAATLEWQAAEQQLRQELEQAQQQQVDQALASARRTAELEKESERRRAQNELDAERERAKGELERAKGELERANGELERANGEREHANGELERAKGELERANGELERANGEREHANGELERAKGELDHAKAELDRANGELERANGEREHASGELERAKGELDHAKAELDRAKGEIEKERQRARAEIDAEKQRAKAASLAVPAAPAVDPSRVSAAVRELDDTRTLSQALDALVAHTGSIAGRSALFVIDGDRLKSWKSSGIPEVDIRSVESSIGGRDLLARAIQAGQGIRTSADLPSPPFARASADRSGLAVPVMIGGRAVAVLYVDSGDPAQSAAASFEMVESLARHASTVVALRTAMRTLDVLRGVPADLTGNGDSASDEQAARRFARLLVSEIKLYNEPAVRAGRQQRDLLQRLGTEIDRARRLYEERVPPSIGARHAYFQQELVQTLADGDPALLGNT